MEKVIEVGQGYIQAGIDWVQEGLKSNPELFVMVTYLVVLIVALLALKELFDILAGANKGALKRKLHEFSEQNQDLLRKYKALEYDFTGLQNHANAMADKLMTLKAIKFDELFPDKLLEQIAEKQGVLEETSQEDLEEVSQEESEQEKDHFSRDSAVRTGGDLEK